MSMNFRHALQNLAGRIRFDTLLGGLSGTTPFPLLGDLSFSNFQACGKSADLEGIVTDAVWRNTEVYFDVDVRNNQHGIVKWRFEVNDSTELLNRGWEPDTLRAGTRVLIHDSPPPDRCSAADSRSVTRHDGQIIYNNTIVNGNLSQMSQGAVSKS